jgi:O-antigen ligase
MLSRGRSLVAPAYLFACLVLGGSAQGIWQNMILQLVGVGIIAWAALGEGEPLARPAKHLLIIAIATIAVIGIQLIPLPASIWAQLGPRQQVADGFRVLGMKIPSEPLSLTPAAGLDALLAIIPSLALVCAMVRLKAYRPQWLAIALIAGTLAGIALGAVQVATAHGNRSPWNLYEQTNYGRAVGFFANRDHMATLLVVTIPFLAALVAIEKRSSMQRYFAQVTITAGAAVVIFVGLVLNGSLAGYGLALPVIAASALIILPPGSRWRFWILGAAAFLLLASTIAIERAPVGAGKLSEHASTAVQSRADLLSTTSRAARDFMPFGSGLGSFVKVYPLYEIPAQITPIYAVHAHNDYLEVGLEVGLAGIILMLLFLAWWSAAFWRAWRTAERGPFARAAAIASAAILVHSLVDFPLRTAAIATCFAMCVGFLTDGGAAAPKEKGQLRPRRHVTI